MLSCAAACCRQTKDGLDAPLGVTCGLLGVAGLERLRFDGLQCSRCAAQQQQKKGFGLVAHAKNCCCGWCWLVLTVADCRLE